MPRFSLLWFFTCTSLVLLLTLSPFNFTHNTDAFSWHYRTTDFRENLFLLSIIGFCFTCRSKPAQWWHWVWFLMLGAAVSIFIESTQLFLPERTSQYWDIIANTISVIPGAVCGLIYHQLSYSVPQSDQKKLIPIALLWPVPLLLIQFTNFGTFWIVFTFFSILIFSVALTSARLFKTTPATSTTLLSAVYFGSFSIPFLVTNPANVCLVLLFTIAMSVLLSRAIQQYLSSKIMVPVLFTLVSCIFLYLIADLYVQGSHKPVIKGVVALIMALCSLAALHNLLQSFNKLIGARIGVVGLLVFVAILSVVTDDIDWLLYPSLVLGVVHYLAYYAAIEQSESR